MVLMIITEKKIHSSFSPLLCCLLVMILHCYYYDFIDFLLLLLTSSNHKKGRTYIPLCAHHAVELLVQVLGLNKQ